MAELASDISREFAGQELVPLVILRGAWMFAADLARALAIPHTMEFLPARSYAGTQSSGEVRIDAAATGDLSGKHVLIVEDIVDSGHTLQAIQARLDAATLRSVRVVSLLRKPRATTNADYVEFEIPDQFVVGYGLDWNGSHRGLAFITTLDRRSDD